MELRAAGATYRQIADLLGVSTSTAWKCVDRGLMATRQEPADKLRPLELVRLDHLQAVAVEVLRAKHALIQGGKLVLDERGQPYTDHGPVLAAINTLLRIQERRAHIAGLDAPTRVDATLSLQVAWERASPEEQQGLLDTELRRVQEEMAQLPDPTAEQFVEAPVGLDPEALAAAVDAALDAASVSDAQREAAYSAIEVQLLSRR
jgi:DNA-directed RNA polymerase specialized sigma24 family protein